MGNREKEMEYVEIELRNLLIETIRWEKELKLMIQR